jgi:hypothetical protein
MTPDIQDNQRDDQDRNHDVRTLKDWLDLGHIGTKNRTQVGQQDTPGERSCERVNAEFYKRHLRDTSRQRNIRTHDWKQAGEECSCTSVLLEEMVGFIRIMLRDKYIATVLQHERPPTSVSDPIGGRRT